MNIEINHLTKKYGSITVFDDIVLLTIMSLASQLPSVNILKFEFAVTKPSIVILSALNLIFLDTTE